MTKMNRSLPLCLLLSACAGTTTQPGHDDAFYTLPGLDHGLIQSPINILSAHLETPRQHRVHLHFNDHFRAVENLGHTVQVDFTPGSDIQFDDQRYAFKQLHFHTPAEHLIDGVTYPMEMHLVSYQAPEQPAQPPRYLVIAVLFKMGASNAFIQEVLNNTPQQAQHTQPILHDSVHLHDLFLASMPEDFNRYYHYQGSLTTPPYTESVEWLVLKTILTASPEQIEAINRIEGNNARHIQAEHGRAVD
ncbi:MAG: carbonic anhydrase family protein [Methylococcales bacterium]|nr:carbonic anhydrase family protein [Methylococcales bacterium]